MCGGELRVSLYPILLLRFRILTLARAYLDWTDVLLLWIIAHTSPRRPDLDIATATYARALPGQRERVQAMELELAEVSARPRCVFHTGTARVY